MKLSPATHFQAALGSRVGCENPWLGSSAGLLAASVSVPGDLGRPHHTRIPLPLALPEAEHFPQTPGADDCRGGMIDFRKSRHSPLF